MKFLSVIHGERTCPESEPLVLSETTREQENVIVREQVKSQKVYVRLNNYINDVYFLHLLILANVFIFDFHFLPF